MKHKHQIIDIPIANIKDLIDNLKHEGIKFKLTLQDDDGNVWLDKYTIMLYDDKTTIYVKLKYL